MSDTIDVTWTQAVSGTRAVATLVGDSIERIALRETGDAANWYVLVALNGLAPPYITDDPAAAGNGVLLAGQDAISVVAPPPVASGVADPTDVFGTDVQLVDGQIAISESGDFATVTGTANLDQAIENAMQTQLLELVYHPTYGNGVYRLLGKANNGSADELAAVYVARCIGADPRINSIETITVQTTGGALAVTATAMAVNGKRLPVGSTLNGASS